MHQLDAIFRPHSVAVIGASQHPGKIGWEIVHNIIRYEFQGKLFPVNPNAGYVHSMKCYAKITDIPDQVDLAIIVVPREHVFSVLDDCGRKGVQGIVMITAGFKEVNEEGARLEKLLAEKLGLYGIRMVGPNCMGVINTNSDVRLDATFAPELPVRGKIGFISQSGALGVTILSLSRERNLGFSMFASIGNKTNLSSNDLMEYWENDPETEMVLLYLENFGNPRKFTQITKRLTQRKPILAVKSGRTLAGARAASSHTGAMANQDVATDAILEQCGVLRASTIDELFDYAVALSSQPLPENNRVAILTNAGGPGIMATDACVSLGLELADFEEKTREALRQILPAETNPNNPLDLLAGATPDHYKRALDALLRDSGVGSVLLINVPPIMIDPVQVAVSASQIAAGYHKPVLGCFMGVEHILQTIRETSHKLIPLYAFPESAARALHGMCRYARVRSDVHQEPVAYPVQKENADQILLSARNDGRETLSPVEMQRLLHAYGIPSAPLLMARSENEAVARANELGYPVVLKVHLAHLQHKSDFGGVILDLRTDSEVRGAFAKIYDRVQERGLDSEWRGVLVQPMVRGGKEVILGMSSDPVFGPLLMFGMGGIYVESMKDTTFRVIPITPQDARNMVESIRGFPLLRGVRGEPSVDLDFLAEMLQRLSQLCVDFDTIREIEINPFLASAARESSLALDARIYF